MIGPPQARILMTDQSTLKWMRLVELCISQWELVMVLVAGLAHSLLREMPMVTSSMRTGATPSVPTLFLSGSSGPPALAGFLETFMSHVPQVSWIIIRVDTHKTTSCVLHVVSHCLISTMSFIYCLNNRSARLQDGIIYKAQYFNLCNNFYFFSLWHKCCSDSSWRINSDSTRPSHCWIRGHLHLC